MVQLKYFGDSRDYFKYDLITHLLKSGVVSNYAFVPMLTNHRVDDGGNKAPKHIDGKSTELLSFIDRCGYKNLEHWEAWLKPVVSSYVTVQPVNKIFFEDGARNKYWESFDAALSNEKCPNFCRSRHRAGNWKALVFNEDGERKVHSKHGACETKPIT